MKNKPISHFAITRFINEQTIGGVILIITTVIALYWSNSSFHEGYHNLWHNFKVGFVWGEIDMVGSLHHWINDGLMAIFFFTVGLEIKREIMGGELNSVRKATLPIFAAIGGMLVPAILYAIVAINNPEYINGWGIPMATDIAFALGLMAMFGKRVNINLKIFLTALAIADDLGAVLVIAFFYTDSIVYTELITAGIFLGVLIAANLAGVRRTLFYAIVGFMGVWVAFMLSGVHATIAGVLIALTIPARTKIDEVSFMTKLSGYISSFKKEPPTKNNLLSKSQVDILSDIEKLNDMAHTPLQKLEHALHPIIIFFILPVFALSNAGVHIDGSIIEMLIHPISIGIIAGLFFGKFLGISIFSRLVVKLKFATLPDGVNWNQIYGVAFLAGIGFTMSMFISELAFTSNTHVEIAKVGIMAASLLSAITGMILLSISLPKKNKG
jgi:Na+:H+ antiporter, NhaA family